MDRKDLFELLKNYSISTDTANIISDILISRTDPIISHIENSTKRFKRVIDSNLSDILKTIQLINNIKPYVSNETSMEYDDLSARLTAIYSEIDAVGKRKYDQEAGQVFLTELPYQGGYYAKSKQLDKDYRKFIDTFDNTVRVRDAHVIAYYMIVDVLKNGGYRAPKKISNAIIDTYYETSLKDKKTDYFIIGLECKANEAHKHLEIPRVYADQMPESITTILLSDINKAYT